MLLRKTSQAVVIPEQPELRYSFSAGLVRIRAEKDIHHAIRRADKLLYEAKSAGRARIIDDR